MRRRQGGFADPLSLISLGFLVVTLLVSTVVINKQNANYSIRSWARMITGRCPDGSMAPDGELEYCPKAKTPTKPVVTQTNPAPRLNSQPTTLKKISALLKEAPGTTTSASSRKLPRLN